ncbi:hypothetical protein [Tepidimicrobium xylanilyticum]|uniref:Uncharacterized protein n=1 Tax=Tepidimicrobium xylanilyticum TaxID=1123352 RepID=A0A1H2V3C3_9FIRM|nr:hypothetical protein [Tepidimicrobium xylanilyticum]GMG96744.1 hypothetical protein EN5CB1_15700 [Tepidimicrobium xylanilyticum]SDW62750.1 hypothetical protein SAMN05660923_01003 [Tepidimicrobium xylanilyticum]
MKAANFKKVLSGLIIILVILGSVFVFSEPGSETDPLVSLSYLEKKIDELKQYIDNRLLNIGENNNLSNTFVVVEISSGQSIIGKGGTEIILRGGTGNGPGKAKIVAMGKDGLSDLTDGKDLKRGEEVPLNHLLIVPRDDGRGVHAINDSVFLVRGEYEIIQGLTEEVN